MIRYFLCNEKTNELLKNLPSINIFQVYPDIKNLNRCFFEISNSKESRAYEKIGNEKTEIKEEVFNEETLRSHNHVFRIRYFFNDNVKFDKFLNGSIRLRVKEVDIPDELLQFVEKEVTGDKEFYSINFLRSSTR